MSEESTQDEVIRLRRYVEHLWWIRDGSKCELCDEIEKHLREWKEERHGVETGE